MSDNKNNTINNDFPALEESKKVPKKTVKRLGKLENPQPLPIMIPEFTSTEKKPDSLVCTRACRNMLVQSSCTFPSCTFAHSKEEIKRPPCFWGDRCRKYDTCPGLHPGQTIEEWNEKNPQWVADYKKLPDKSPKREIRATGRAAEKPATGPAERLKSAPIRLSASMSAPPEPISLVWKKKISEQDKKKPITLKIPKSLSESALKIAIENGYQDITIQII